MTEGLAPVPNIFIKANYTFIAEGRSFSYVNQHISLFGVSGIKWSLFDPKTAVGRATKVQIELLVEGNRPKFETPGEFTAERSSDASYLGIRFNLSPQNEQTLRDAIAKFGSVPSTHIRKYPRIPATAMISTMPMHVILKYGADLLSCRVANISPNGILLSTDNPKGMTIVPGERLHGHIEPRGDFSWNINFEGMVCRILEDWDSKTKNVVHYLGIRFMAFEPGHRSHFILLLQDILLRLKIELEKSQKARKA